MKETSEKHNNESGFWRRWMMPWGLSALFHGGLALALAFLVFLPEPAGPPAGRPVAYAPDSHPHQVTPRPMRTIMAPEKLDEGKGTAADDMWIEPLRPDRPGIGDSDPASGEEETLWRELERSAASGTEFRLDDLAESEGFTSFFGASSLAQDVVYLIDFSVSMEGSFEAVRREMLRSIGRLGAEQRFHIILFSEGPPLEAQPRRLVPATHANKGAAARFLASVRPFGRTQPIEALSRAYAVLRAGRSESGLIYLLTDGEFPDPARVMQAINSLGAGSGVRINTYQYGDDEPAASTLRQIAEESGGVFVRIRN